MSPQELRKLTDLAIDRAKQEREMKIKADYEAEIRKDKIAALKADKIIENIPSRAEKEALCGRNHAIVMSLKYGEYKEAAGTGTTKGTTIAPEAKAAMLVWKHCQDAGFNPTLEFWHDGVGIEGGYNIVIHW